MSAQTFVEEKTSKEDEATAENKKATVDSSAAITLTFPPQNLTADNVLSHLTPFKDESSAYAVVAKSCLQLTNYAGNGSCIQMEDTSSVAGTALFHDISYAKVCSASFAALIECIQNHKDRRCRIVACKTLGILARAAYARIRHSPALFSLREATQTRLEDEVGTDIPVALCNAALDDDDDGVAAAAVEAIGIVTLSTQYTPGTLTEDELLREIESMSYCRIAPYAPSMKQLATEDPSIPCTELQCRVFENIVAPRLLQLTDRILRLEQEPHVLTVLPTLTAALVHQLKTAPSLVFGMDRGTFAKRWGELDAVGLADIVVQSLLLPCLQGSTSGVLALAASMSVLRLAHAVGAHGGTSWVLPACRWVVTVLLEELSTPFLQQPVETRLALTATLLVALRSIPLHERTKTLILLVDLIGTTLPSTTKAAHGISSPGALLSWNGYTCYRRPARIAFWTEVALHFFIDGPVEDPTAAGGALGAAGATAASTGAAAPTGAIPPLNTTSRQEALKRFLSYPSIMTMIVETNKPGQLFSNRDELLLSFTSVAIDTGRRFRGGIDGSIPVMADPTVAAEVDEWLKLSWIILTIFCPCVNMRPPGSGGVANPKLVYLEEDLSLFTAGLASYVTLVQEYLHFVGLIHPGSSVALKLTANACPPHLLWDQLTESASFLSRFDTVDMGYLDKTTKLMDEFVAREVKQGIPSHHMRLFLMSLAADHWMQGRVSAIRSQFEAAASGQPATTKNLSLNLQSAREIVLALSPKRMLAKIFESHVPPVDVDGKKKKDPIKRLALETVRVCVACIENVALTACDWRRRFGSGQEPKHLVSVCVGILQGKIDETPADDMMRSVMTPLCEAAVGRIQAFYESDAGGALDQTFPASELVTQPIKTKIKPLVSSAKPPPLAKGDFQRGYFMQLSRQWIASRIELAVQSAPAADSVLSAARPRNWLRLAVPPLPESKDARVLGNHGEALANWGSSVQAASASSDATTLVVAYSPRRYSRFDGEDEYRLTILMRAYNMTAIEFVEGLRLEFGIVQTVDDLNETQDPISQELITSLNGNIEDYVNNKPLVSSAVVYRSEIKPGEHLTWEVALNHISAAGSLKLIPSVVYRNVPEEPLEAGAKWVGEKPSTAGDASTVTGGESKSGEDDFQVTMTEGGSSAFKTETADSDNVTLAGEPLVISPLAECQPCPLVFFRDCWGDIDTFRFLWFRLEHQLAPMSIVPSTDPSRPQSHTRSLPCRIAELSSLTWPGEAIPGGYATRVWAFMTYAGNRLLCVLAESDGDNGDEAGRKLALVFRSDDRSLLYCLAASQAAREAVVDALVPGMTACLPE